MCREIVAAAARGAGETRFDVQGRAEMLENAELKSLPAETLPAATVGGEARSDVGELVGELRAAGVLPRLLSGAAGPGAGGIALPVPVQELLRSPVDCERALQRIAALARAGMPVTLSLRDLGGGDDGIGALEEFCTMLREGLGAEGLSTEGIGVSLQSHQVPLKAYLLITTALLGGGSRYVILDSLQMRHHDDRRVQRETDANWSFLWRRRSARPPLMPAYAASVTTRCALLGDEAATAVLPELGVQVPLATAWLPLVIGLPDFSDGRGRLAWDALEHALCRTVDLGERLLDCLRWPDNALERDAAENRRLAIAVGGVGDLVVERGAAPSDLACLKWIDSIVARLHAVLWARSRLLARRLGPLPSLSQPESTAGWRCDRKRSDWQQRWARALASSAIRHRNLLVLSPYSVLPTGADRASDYLDLLHVLHHADAFSFAAPPASCFRSVGEFAAFHRRAWAVMQRRNAASFVATGV
jgi:hypothetical protein